MKKFKQIVEWFLVKTDNHLDASIVGLGVFIAVVIYGIAFKRPHSIAQDYLVNLSAGVLTVVLTVLLVDKIRQWHLKRELRDPISQAVFRIKSSHSLLLLLLSIMNYKEKSAYRDNIAKKNKMFDQDTHDAEVAKLANENKNAFVVSQNSNTLRSVKQCVESIERELLRVRENYNFATDNAFKSELAALINKIEAVKGMWVIRDIDTSTLASFTDADADDFLRIAMLDYLSSYSAFAVKYKTLQ